MVIVELLYFDGCPGWSHAWSALGEALASCRVDATVRLRNIDDVPAAQCRGFAGSPTVRINGRDLEGYDGPALRACRRYPHNGGRGWPDPTELRRAIEAATVNDEP